MKKFLIGIVLLLVVVVGVVFGLVFTKAGNDLLKPLIESKLKAQLPVSVELKNFQISPMDIDLLLGKDSLIKVTGNVGFLDRSLDLRYFVDIKNLADLKPLTHVALRGPLKTEGSVEGHLDDFKVVGSSDLARSDTKYRVTVKSFEPREVIATIKGAELAKIFYMLKLPHYADAAIDATVALNNLDPKHLSGKVLTHVKNGRTDPETLKKEFDVQEARILFTATQDTVIKNAKSVSNIRLDSSVATVESKGALFDLSTGKLDATYEAFIPNLDRLYFATKQHMRGELKITGKVQKDKNLLVTVHSDTLGGTFDMKMLDNNLKATLRHIKFVELTDMLLYPRIFDSTLDANLTYDIATKQGKLNAKAVDGHILPNKMSFLLRQMANFDITKEIYKETILISSINGKKILSDLDMKSRFTHITSKRALVDLATERVDAKLRVEIQKRPIYVKLRGKLKSPKISIDARSIVKERAKRAIEKRLQKRFGDKIPEGAKSILKLF